MVFGCCFDFVGGFGVVFVVGEMGLVEVGSSVVDVFFVVDG